MMVTFFLTTPVAAMRRGTMPTTRPTTTHPLSSTTILPHVEPLAEHVHDNETHDSRSVPVAHREARTSASNTRHSHNEVPTLADLARCVLLDQTREIPKATETFESAIKRAWWRLSMCPEVTGEPDWEERISDSLLGMERWAQEEYNTIYTYPNTVAEEASFSQDALRARDETRAHAARVHGRWKIQRDPNFRQLDVELPHTWQCPESSPPPAIERDAGEEHSTDATSHSVSPSIDNEEDVTSWSVPQNQPEGSPPRRRPRDPKFLRQEASAPAAPATRYYQTLFRNSSPACHRETRSHIGPIVTALGIGTDV